MSLLPNYNKFFAAGLGSIWDQQWVPAEPYQGRKVLLSVPPIQNLAFWHVQVRPEGEIYLPEEFITPWLENTNEDNDAPDVGTLGVPLDRASILQAADQVSQLGGLSRLSTSMLKVRLTWKDRVSLRCIDFDLSAGVDVISPPAHFVQLELLVPVRGTGLTPPEFQQRIPMGFGTSVIARADCVHGTVERNFNLTYTDTRYLEAGDVFTDRTRVPRRKGVQRVQVFSRNIPTPTTRFIHDRNPPGAAVDVFGRFVVGAAEPLSGGGQFPGRGTTTQHLDFPGSANAIEFQLPQGQSNNTITTVQELTF